MKHLIETPKGNLIIGKMTADCDDPFDLVFEMIKMPQTIENKLNEALKAEKVRKFNKYFNEFPERLEEKGYKKVEDIKEFIGFTTLDITCSRIGEGISKTEITRYCFDEDDFENCLFEYEASVPIDLTEQAEDLKRLVMEYFEKRIFQKNCRVVFADQLGEYIL